MKTLHLIISVLLFLFVLSCGSKKEEPIAVIVEPIQPQTSITFIIDNPVNSSMLVKTLGDDPKTYSANLQYDTIRIFTDKPKMLYIEQSMFIWHKMTAEPNDTITIKTVTEQVVISWAITVNATTIWAIPTWVLMTWSIVT